MAVRLRESGTELVRGRFVDASGRGSNPQDSFITVSPSGQMLAGGRGRVSSQSTVVIVHESGAELTLTGFAGDSYPSGSFIADGSLIAITERSRSIGFWRTDTGDFVARFVVPVALEGTIVDGVVGIPPEVLRHASPLPDGWPIEGPASPTGPEPAE